jgi:4'-phosphopantetheinyl transferase
MNQLIEWPTITQHVPIERAMVHVLAWDFACTDAKLNEYNLLLDRNERVRMSRYRFQHDQVRYVVSRAKLRLLLGRYLGVDPRSIGFTAGEFGKPRVNLRLGDCGLDFNLSHTRHLAVVAIGSDVKLGVDIEELLPIETEIAEHHFSSKERSDLSVLTGAEWLQGFYNCWTRKEAILKAEGAGLSRRLDSFDVTVLPGFPPQLVAAREEAGLTHNWHLTMLAPSSMSVGALATSLVPREVACFHYAD